MTSNAHLSAHVHTRPVALHPVAIIDIGSNSVRLVTYDNLDRAPVPSFNEKSLCALGNGVVTTGKLAKSGVEKALVALRRFRVLIEILGIEDVRVIATAAARDASNGPEFLAAAKAALGGREIALLSGTREARLSALGVLSGIHAPDGLVGDMGGGSLELIDVKGERIGTGMSLPLGGLALMDASGRSPKAAAKIVREALAKCDALDALQGRTFYAVGGTWRSLAKLHMGQRAYQLMVMHGYTIPAREAADLGALGGTPRFGEDLASLATPTRSMRRAGRSSPMAPLVLEEVVRLGRQAERGGGLRPYGVREKGCCSKRLDAGRSAAARPRSSPPSAEAQSPRLARDARLLGPTSCAWTDTFFAEVSRRARDRSRTCACATPPAYLCRRRTWRAHPDHRGDHELERSSPTARFCRGWTMPAGLVPGAGRRRYRHGGFDEEIDAGAGMRALLMPPQMPGAGARCSGPTMRVGYQLLGAAMGGVLGLARRCGCRNRRARVTLALPRDLVRPRQRAVACWVA